jgi:hypothetical protein
MDPSDAEHSCGVSVQDDPTISSITGPVLVVANTFDQCRCSRSKTNTAPQKGTTLLESLDHSLPKYLMTFGSKHKVDGEHECDGRTPHGFYNIEASVIVAVAGWIKRGGAMIPQPKN